MNLKQLFREAVDRGMLPVVKYLVEAGANVRADDDYVLRWAAHNGHLEVVKYLVSVGADVRARHDWALRYAANNCHTAVVDYLENELKKKKENKRGCN